MRAPRQPCAHVQEPPSHSPRGEEQLLGHAVAGAARNCGSGWGCSAVGAGAWRGTEAEEQVGPVKPA